MCLEHLVIPDKKQSYQRLLGLHQKTTEPTLSDSYWPKMDSLKINDDNKCNRLKNIKYV